MTTPPNAPDHGCSCGRPDCQYDKAWGNPLRETPSAPDDKPNAPEVDVLAFFDDAEKVWADAYTGANADTIGGVTMESVKEACARIEGRLRNVRQVRTAVAELLTREAALAERNDLLSRANIAYSEQVAKLTGRALNSEEREAALVAEVDLLRRVQASMATEGVALVAERDALKDDRDQLNSDYLTAINAANVIAGKRDALTAEVGALRETVGLFADDAQRWSEVERRFNDSKTSAASMVLEGLGLEPTPYRDFAETVDAARAEAGHG